MNKNQTNEKKPELLAPAGNLTKLKCALHFGADAVYVGGKELSLRAMGGNFSDTELEEGISYAHSINKKVYVAVNVFAKNSDFKTAEKYFAFLKAVGADAAIISDAGLFDVCKKAAPGLEIHLSTQANTTNKYAARFWSEQGAARIVLARELSLAEIKEIHSFLPKTELEAFVHGAMCMSYSGRCMLSGYFSGRSANRGECVQPCRWSYKLSREERADDKELYVEEDSRGVYFMNSRDLNLISRIPEYAEAGVSSFKIEGRMKSEFYIAGVTLAYRRAIDEYFGTGKIESLPLLKRELENVAHRPYTEAFFNGDKENTVSTESEREQDKYKFIAQVLSVETHRKNRLLSNNVKNSFPNDSNENRILSQEVNVNEELIGGGSLYNVEMRNRFFKGDILEILSPDKNVCYKAFKVSSVFNDKDEAVDDAKLVQHHYKIACPYPLQPGDILRKQL